MRAVVVTTASAINPIPRMEIITSVFSRLGICEGFMVLRLLASAHGGPEQRRPAGSGFGYGKALSMVGSSFLPTGQPVFPLALD